MICPVDKSDMIVVEHSHIELDHCPRCGGVWFDATELELLLESLGRESHGLFLANILKSPEAKAAEKKRKCPICRRDMKQTNVGQRPQVLIDVCPKGHGLWFDGGEVGQLLEQVAEPPPEKAGSQQLAGFLKEVFKARGKSV